MKSAGGQSLIEVIVSVGIAVVLAIAVISASLVSARTARSARNGTQATKLAEEYIEQIRVFRDRNGYNSGPASLTSYGNGNCFILSNSNPDPSTWSLSTSGCPKEVPLGGVSFSRKLAIADGPSANTKLITVTVTWGDSGGAQTVTSQTILSQWSAL